MKNQRVTMTVILLASLTFFACRTEIPTAPVPTVQETTEPGAVSDPASSDHVLAFQESEIDILGFHEISPAYRAVIDAGVRVVNVRELGSFFAVWIPYNYASQDEHRVMLLVHGSDDDAYSTIAGRMKRALHHGYALVAVQWWMGEGDRYLEPEVVYLLASTAMDYVGQAYGADIHNAAYEGFSRGSSIAYQIAYSDRVLGSNYFRLFICHSGGMHKPGPPFIENLQAGAFGDDAFEGQHFYMYCGMKDEQWGTAMCEYMDNAERTVTKYGGIVERYIRDPDGNHGGFLKNDAYYEDAIATWFDLASR